MALKVIKLSLFANQVRLLILLLDQILALPVWLRMIIMDNLLDYGVFQSLRGTWFRDIKLFYLKNKLFVAGIRFPHLSILEVENYRNVVSEYNYAKDSSDIDNSFYVYDLVVDRIENKYITCRLYAKEGVDSIKIGSTSHSVERYRDPTGQEYLLKQTKAGDISWGVKLGVLDRSYLASIRRRGLAIDGTGYIYVSGLYIENKVLGNQPMPNIGCSRHPGCTSSFLHYIMKIKDKDFALSPYWFEGNTFIDKNSNCQLNTNDIGLPYSLILKNGQYYTISDKEGKYFLPNENESFALESKIINSNFYKYVPNVNDCSTPRQVVVENYRLQDPNSINFGYKVKPCSYLSVDITNQRRRRCFMSSTTVEYQNQGFADAQNVEVKVEYPDYIFPVSSSPTWTRKEGNSYFFNIGSLAAGNTEKIVFQDSVICGIEEIRGLTQCVKATISPANSCEDWTDNENKYEISGRCVGGGVARYTIKNLTNTATNSIPYRLYANSKVFAERNTLLPANGEVEIEVFTNGMTMRMELFPQNHDPISAFVEGCQVAIPYKTKAENPKSCCKCCSCSRIWSCSSSK